MLSKTSNTGGSSARQKMINGQRSRSSNEYGETQSKRQQVEFIALARLAAGPIHKKTLVYMKHRNGNDHVAHNAECGDSSEQADKQTQATQKLRTYGQKGERRRNSHMTEHRHRP